MGLIDILGTFQDPKNVDEGAGKLVNVRVVPRQATEGKQGKARLVGSPGLGVQSQPSTSPCIALGHALGAIWSGHADGSIYHHVETPTPTFAGKVLVNADQPIIRFAEDRTAMAIASNANANTGITSGRSGTAYTADFINGVVNAGFDASIQFDPTAVAELDNMTIWSAASNAYALQDSKLYRSVPLAPANVDPNYFGTKEARADRVVDLAISQRILWVLGALSLEQWYDNGADPTNADMPFTPFPNSLLGVGIASRTTLAVLRDTVGFVGTDRRIWRCAGQSGTAISPAWVDLLLQSLSPTEVSQLTAYAYGQGGNDFYVLTLPGQWTIEMAANGLWCYRQSPGRADHAARCAVEHDGGNTYIGLDTGHVCAVDINTPQEPAGTLSRTVITPWVGSEEKRQTFNSLEVTSSMRPVSGSITADWSEDAAATWHGSRSIPLPQPGTRRAVARKMGHGRRRQFRIQAQTVTAPFSLDELFVDITPGT